MTLDNDQLDRALDRAHHHAYRWLLSVDERDVPPSASVEEVAAALGPDLPDGPTDAAKVVDLLAEACEPGLTAMPSGRFFGFVIGGTHPAALGADWLVSAWDQNCVMRRVTPAHTAVEEAAARWLLDLLRLPTGAAVGFVTSATMANFTGLAAGRDALLRRAGWDVTDGGLTGAPRVRVLVGEERHESIDLVLRFLGLGRPTLVPADAEGRIRPDALGAALDEYDGPTIVCLQAGNVHSGSFDPFAECVAFAHRHDAWVHVDGAFGLWAGASPTYRHLVEGCAGADSWSTDAHKTLNVPYDCGIAVVREPADVRAAMGMEGAYLIRDDTGDPFEKVPELSRRGRAFPVWAVLRSLGRSGVADLVDRLCAHARSFADGLTALDGAEVVNEVPFTQVCATFGDDDRTRQVVQRILADGTAWMSGSRWHDLEVLRISVSNWSTSDDDVARSLAALARAVAD
ncbi:MAG: aminotransferase class V-fold PLP-dependent enzyme [Propionibacteriales bacterium]|nr:aminotransferase class V-fold PLP-dependent enzyme [Propionibacteriales bacterium]